MWRVTENIRGTRICRSGRYYEQRYSSLIIQMIQFILVLWFTIIITNTLIIKWIMWSLCHLLQICILSEIKLQLLNSTGIKGQFASKRNTSNESRKQCNKGTVKLLNTSKCNKVLHFLYDKIIYSIRVFNYTYSIFFCSGSFLFNQWGYASSNWRSLLSAFNQCQQTIFKNHSSNAVQMKLSNSFFSRCWSL